jgi:hypothetical protein
MEEVINFVQANSGSIQGLDGHTGDRLLEHVVYWAARDRGRNGDDSVSNYRSAYISAAITSEFNGLFVPQPDTETVAINSARLTEILNAGGFNVTAPVGGGGNIFTPLTDSQIDTAYAAIVASPTPELLSAIIGTGMLDAVQLNSIIATATASHDVGTLAAANRLLTQTPVEGVRTPSSDDLARVAYTGGNYDDLQTLLNAELITRADIREAITGGGVIIEGADGGVGVATRLLTSPLSPKDADLVALLGDEYPSLIHDVFANATFNAHVGTANVAFMNLVFSEGGFAEQHPEQFTLDGGLVTTILTVQTELRDELIGLIDPENAEQMQVLASALAYAQSEAPETVNAIIDEIANNPALAAAVREGDDIFPLVVRSGVAYSEFENAVAAFDPADSASLQAVGAAVINARAEDPNLSANIVAAIAANPALATAAISGGTVISAAMFGDLKDDIAIAAMNGSGETRGAVIDIIVSNPDLLRQVMQNGTAAGHIVWGINNNSIDLNALPPQSVAFLMNIPEARGSILSSDADFSQLSAATINDVMANISSFSAESRVNFYADVLGSTSTTVYGQGQLGRDATVRDLNIAPEVQLATLNDLLTIAGNSGSNFREGVDGVADINSAYALINQILSNQDEGVQQSTDLGGVHYSTTTQAFSGIPEAEVVAALVGNPAFVQAYLDGELPADLTATIDSTNLDTAIANSLISNPAMWANPEVSDNLIGLVTANPDLIPAFLTKDAAVAAMEAAGLEANFYSAAVNDPNVINNTAALDAIVSELSSDPAALTALLEDPSNGATLVTAILQNLDAENIGMDDFQALVTAVNALEEPARTSALEAINNVDLASLGLTAAEVAELNEYVTAQSNAMLAPEPDADCIALLSNNPNLDAQAIEVACTPEVLQAARSVGLNLATFSTTLLDGQVDAAQTLGNTGLIPAVQAVEAEQDSGIGAP